MLLYRFPLLRSIVTAWVLVLVSFSVLAAERGYQVEVLVFAHVSQNTGGELFFPPQQGTDDWSEALALWAVDAQTAPPPPGYHALGAESLQMRAHWKRLRAVRDYRPVAHAAWRQPARAEPQPARLQVYADDCNERPELDGVLRVRNLGELVFEFDLRYLDCVATVTGSAPVFRIPGTSKVLFNRLYYFDHPVAGVLLEVRRD